ncbi:MAG: hypothetical protein JW971_08840 [Synergistales bacterium]|nr:hypothetical protein [Synergistales bacterium]
MGKKGKTLVILCVAVAFAILMTIPAFAMPDLVAWVSSRGVPIERGDEIIIPFSVTVQNRGTEPAQPFKVSVEYEVVSGGIPSLLSGVLQFRVPGQSDIWAPHTTGLLPNGPPPASTVTFSGELILSSSLSGAVLRICAIADSTAGEEFAEPAGHVRESDENNNSTPWIEVRPMTGLPDLVFRSQTRPAMFIMEDRYIVENRSAGGGFAFTAENRGTAPAGPFRITVEYEILEGVESHVSRHGFVANIPVEDISSEGLAVGRTQAFNNLVLKFPEGLAGARLKVRVRIDDSNSVAESDEFNNVGPWSPPFFLPRRTDSQRIPGTLILRTLGTLFRGSLHLNNFAGPTDDFQLGAEPYRQNDSWIRIGPLSESFTPPLFHYGEGATRSWYYLCDINGEFGGPGALYFSGDRIAMRVTLETGGPYEIRGWEYTRPYWYDSPPDIDLTRIELFVALRPIIREGRFSYDRVTVTPNIDLTLHGFWEFVDNVILSNGITDYLRNTINSELRKRFEAILTSDEIRIQAEDQIERVLDPAIETMGIRRLLSVRVVGDSMEFVFER